MWETNLLILHILAVMVAVGTVTVTDYLHLLSIRDPKLEKRILFVFPHLSNLILGALFIIYVTGLIMLYISPHFLSYPLFQLKAALVLLVTINGFILHKHIFPKIEKGTKLKDFTCKLIKKAAFSGSVSVVSWYSIVILSITKNAGYSIGQFLIAYSVTILIAYYVALRLELGHRKKRC